MLRTISVKPHMTLKGHTWNPQNRVQHTTFYNMKKIIHEKFQHPYLEFPITKLPLIHEHKIK